MYQGIDNTEVADTFSYNFDSLTGKYIDTDYNIRLAEICEETNSMVNQINADLKL